MNTLQVSTTLLSAFAWTYWTFIQNIFTGKQILQLYYTNFYVLNFKCVYSELAIAYIIQMMLGGSVKWCVLNLKHHSNFMPSKPVHLWFYKYCILINYANQKLPINDFTNNLCNLHSKNLLVTMICIERVM